MRIARSCLIAAAALAAVVLPRSGASGPQVGGALNADPLGWAFHVGAAASPSKACVVMSAHAAPDDDSLVGIRAACWDGNAWTPLGGRISHPAHDQGAGFGGAAFAPAITMLGDTPYVAWYEGSGYVHARIFVAHWDGSAWVMDGAEGLTASDSVASQPVLSTLGGVVYAAWSEGGCVHVAHLDAGWTADGGCVRGDGGATSVRGLALASIGDALHLAIAEDATTKTSVGEFSAANTRVPIGVSMLRLENGSWQKVGGTIGAGKQAHGVALADVGGVAYVAWVGQTGPVSDVHVAHWDGSGWAPDGGVGNADPKAGWAQTPSLGVVSGTLYMAFAEHSPGQPARIQVRHLASGALAVDAVANVDPNASAEGPRLFSDGASLRVAFTEKPKLPGVGTVYVRSLP